MSQPNWREVAENLARLPKRYEDIGESEIADQIEEALKDAYSLGWTAHWRAVSEPGVKKMPEIYRGHAATEKLKAAAKKKLREAE